MARSIPLELPPRDPREELRKRLDEAPLEHAEALLDSYKVLKQLHDHGVFELLRGAKSDESVRAIRSAIILGKILGSIHPDVLRGVDVAVSETLECHEQSTIEPRGIFSLLSQFRRKELRRSIALVNHVLETLGNRIKLRGSCD